MALREMMEMKETMGSQGMPESLDTMAAVRSGGMPPPPPQAQGMMPPAPSPAMAPQAMPQPAPAMGGPAMPPSGLAGIAPPVAAPMAPQAETDPLKIMGGIALATLMERGEKKNMFESFTKAAEDRGMSLPSSDSGLMRLAAEGGPVLYRRDSGPLNTGPTRDEILKQMQDLAVEYGVEGSEYVAAGLPNMISFQLGQPLNFGNNPRMPGGGYAELLYRRGEGPGGYQPRSGGAAAFESQYNALLNQLQNVNNRPAEPAKPKEFIGIDDGRYGGLNDPNLPSFDAAQQRNQYRLATGFFEQPPGPTVNTERLLTQAYGEGSPILSEIMQGLQPRRNPNDFETARLAYANLPDVQLPPEVEAKSGGGLYELAAGGEFAGRVPGDGGGMQDNVYMPIKEGEEQVATLAVSPTEYVVDSHTMAALGNGNPDKGADYMDAVVKGIRQEAYGTDEQPNEINGLQTLVSMMG
tara:strand:- start:254 stop:1651 length:1398 start_codon:yes stop_codon:yes gene_type:complete